MNGLKNGLQEGLISGLNNGLAEGLANGLTNGLFVNEYPFDIDANKFLLAANINDIRIKNAINKLVINLKAANIWNKMKAIYPFVGGTSTTHKFNLKDPRDSDAAFRLVFTGGWTHSANGATPNGTNAYADSNLNQSLNFSVDDNMHMSFYSRTNVSQVSVDIGNKTVAPSNIYNLLSIRRSDQSNTTYYGINTVSGFATFIDSNSAAFYLSTRIGTLTNGFRNNTKTATNNSAASTRANLKIVLSALNEGGSISPGFYSTKQCAFASIGDGLSDAEALSLYNAVQTFQTTLGRQV